MRSLLVARRRTPKGSAGTAPLGGLATVGPRGAGGAVFEFDDEGAPPPPDGPGGAGSGFITDEPIDDSAFDPATETTGEFVNEPIDGGDDGDDDGGGNDVGFTS